MGQASAASGHRHHEPSGPALIEAARVSVEKSGERWTAMRESVFRALAAGDRPASAYDIAETVSRSEGRRIAANSVYRILDLFVAANVAMRVESANAYLANVHPGCAHDCIFLVCDGCGQTTHLDNDGVTGGVRAAAEAAGFSPERPVIEVRGRCGACRPAVQVE